MSGFWVAVKIAILIFGWARILLSTSSFEDHQRIIYVSQALGSSQHLPIVLPYMITADPTDALWADGSIDLAR